MVSSILLQELNKIILMLFKSYYDKAELELPEDVELREFALQPFGKDTYVRHLSFSSALELKNFLLENVPLHLFYSTAKYQIPSAKEMDEKGWMGADLQFDIDADELCEVRKINFCPVCGAEVEGEKCPKDNAETIEFVEISTECINKALENTLIIRDILKEDFGLTPELYFSGNRGFHVYVKCSGDCALLDSDDRKEIVDYIKGIGVPKYSSALSTDPGWAGRKARGIQGTVVDEEVTIDVKRLFRIPNSIHGKSGLLVRKIEGNFEFSESLSPFSGYVTFLPYISGKFQILGETLELSRGIPIKLTASLGVYAHLKGLGEVKLYVR
ncbi:DNA primase small subunit PriS [Acidianus sp. HS-5]|uniref:DNA primase small subunit PriS n=1 Tax=Acidianus sp. HS-5 TaxID=2886040 RepID=UPI001F265E52|nr:DNA primase small subunit PriS [Acidianus sp. HS-5]BDC19753.1 DNA primase [Acidianus sp. HS-5]